MYFVVQDRRQKHLKGGRSVDKNLKWGRCVGWLWYRVAQCRTVSASTLQLLLLDLVAMDVLVTMIDKIKGILRHP